MEVVGHVPYVLLLLWYPHDLSTNNRSEWVVVVVVVRTVEVGVPGKTGSNRSGFLLLHLGGSEDDDDAVNTERQAEEEMVRPTARFPPLPVLPPWPRRCPRWMVLGILLWPRSSLLDQIFARLRRGDVPCLLPFHFRRYRRGVAVLPLHHHHHLLLLFFWKSWTP